MSTKIYIGLISNTKNVWELREQIKGIVEPIFQAEYEKLVTIALEHEGESWMSVMRLLPFSYSHWDFPIDTRSSRDVRTKVFKLVKELHASALRTLTNADIAYSVHILPNGLGKTLEPLVLLFSEGLGDKMRQALIDAKVVSEYGYWDNTDRPDYVTQMEWNKRKKAWDLLDIPRTDGLTLEMQDEVSIVYSI